MYWLNDASKPITSQTGRAIRGLVNRRTFLLLALTLPSLRAHAQPKYPAVVAGPALSFPRDHGAHPAFRTEWWYLTGTLRDTAQREVGVQITFFRSRPGVAEGGSSTFAPRQLLFAHAAIADPRVGHLQHDQRALRTGFGLAEASETTTDVRLDDWSLKLDAGMYAASVAARDFALRLTYRATQPIVLQGAGGVSRKGPAPAQASYYYSRPHLAVSGSVQRNGRDVTVSGDAWLDHEWSSEYLAPEARGWDWVGLNLDDGGALMAFRIRDHHGGVFWAGGSYRDARGHVRTFGPNDVAFTPVSRWTSPRTGIEYPIAFRVVAGSIDVTLEPLMADQELDSRASVGTVYWEGAVRSLAEGRTIGHGYLELTGYGTALRI